MFSLRTGDGAVRRELEMRGFVRSSLENDDGEAKLKDDLHRDERVEIVIKALLSGAEEAGDEQKSADTREGRPSSGEDGEGDGTVDADDAS